MFKVNNQNSRVTFYCLYCLRLHIFCCFCCFCFFAVGYYSQGIISLFHESSCGQPFLNGYGIFQKSTCNHKLQIYKVFERYFYLRCVAISKEHVHPYLWVVPSLFKNVTCSDLGYCVSLKQALAVITFLKANSQFQLQPPIRW